MRFGLRVQLLALLGVLLLLAFGPLSFAISAGTRVGYEQLKREGAQKLALSVASHVSEARPHLDERQLLDLLSAEVQGGAVQAIFVFGPAGPPLLRAGEPELVGAGDELRPSEPKLHTWNPSGRRDLLAAFVPDARGGVATLTRLELGGDEAEPLTQLMGLYLVVSALLVLVVAYFALTRWIVEPLLALDRAAERVAQGSRTWTKLSRGAPELVRLGQSLATMTQNLREEEDSLRRKIEEVEATTEKLKAAQASLVRSERLATVGRLAAGLAHEIGNPISALMGFEDLLLEGGLSKEEERDFLQRMRKETERIHRVLGDLLAYARPTHSEGRERLVSGSVEEAVAHVLTLLRPQKDFRQMRWSAEVSPGLPPVPLAPEELTQILLNLVMNAVDACQRRGSIEVHAHENEAGEVVLRVNDDGPGISPEIRETLFEPFVTTKEVGKGTGLGLAVTRGLVEAAGGTVRLDPDHAPGASFVIVLPAAASTSSSSETA